MVRPPRFHTKRRRNRSVGKRLAAFAVILVIAVAVAFVVRLPGMGGEWQQIDTRFSLCGERNSNGCVIDGDTIMLGKRKIRLSGYNAPELKGECPAESALAVQSRNALRDWLNAGPFVMDGGDEPPFDQYGRELRVLKRGGEWLSETMIERELAQGSGWGFERGGWCG